MADTPLHPQKLVEMGKWKDYRQQIWGNSFTWSWVRPWSQLQGILIHHSVTKHDATPDDIALLHKARGWAGVGYHFIIDKAGVVHYVGDISTARAHVQNKNEKFLGICLIGDFTKHLPSDEQIISAHELCKFFFFQTPSLPTLTGWHQLQGHKDQQATACPGSSWGGGDMRDRIINRIPYTPAPTPTPTPEPTPTPTPQPPVEDWKKKYEDEVNAHTQTKEAFKKFKEDAALSEKVAVQNETQRIKTKILELADSL